MISLPNPQLTPVSDWPKPNLDWTDVGTFENSALTPAEAAFCETLLDSGVLPSKTPYKSVLSFIRDTQDNTDLFTNAAQELAAQPVIQEFAYADEWRSVDQYASPSPISYLDTESQRFYWPHGTLVSFGEAMSMLELGEVPRGGLPEGYTDPGLLTPLVISEEAVKIRDTFDIGVRGSQLLASVMILGGMAAAYDSQQSLMFGAATDYLGHIENSLAACGLQFLTLAAATGDPYGITRSA